LKDQDLKQHNELSDNDTTQSPLSVPSVKRTFVEPEISQPVDVLEATTFFQLTDSGATN
jgi:hypothetical protein